MADNSSGMPVLTIGAGSSSTTQYVGTKIFDTGGTNVAAVNANNALKIDLGNYNGSAVGAGNAIHVQPGTGAIFATGTATAALADNTANPTTSLMGNMLHAFDGTTWDRARSTDASDGNAALTTTGILAAGVGPGFARRFNPANLGTATNSTSAVDVNGATAIAFEVNTSTTGTYVVEITIDGTTWIAAPTYQLNSNLWVTGVSLTPTVGDVFVSSVAGMRQWRLRTASTLGATMAHQVTVSLGDPIALLPQLTPRATLADAYANPSSGGSAAYLFGYNGSTWDRLRSTTANGLVVDVSRVLGTVTVDSELPTAAALSDTTANPTTPMVGGALMLWDSTGSQWVRGKSAQTLADALANPGLGVAMGQSFLMGYNGSTWDRVRTANTGRLQVDVVTGGGSNASIFVDNGAFTPDTSSIRTVGCLFDDTAGAALTENDVAAARIDSKRAWVMVGEDATTRNQKWAISAAGALSSNITQIGGSTPSATIFLPTRITDGTAYYTKTGQTAATASFAQLSDQTNVANIIAGTNALKTDLSSVAGTATVTANISGVQSIGGPTASDAALTAHPVTVGARASTASPTDMSADGDVVNLWASLKGALNVTLRDTSGNYVGAGGGTQYVGDAAATSTPTGTMGMGLANAAAPADVSANNDAVAMWMLRNGSPVVNIASGGALITVGQKTMSNSFPVVLASDQSAVASNITQVSGATQSATNPLFVRLTDGSAAYSASSAAPTSPQFSTQTSASLGAGSNVDLQTADIGGTTGQLMGIDVASTVPLKAIISTVSGGTPTTRVVLFAQPYSGLQWRSPFKTFITQASGANNKFRVNVTNKDASVAADVYASFYWDQV